MNYTSNSIVASTTGSTSFIMATYCEGSSKNFDDYEEIVASKWRRSSD